MGDRTYAKDYTFHFTAEAVDPEGTKSTVPVTVDIMGEIAPLNAILHVNMSYSYVMLQICILMKLMSVCVAFIGGMAPIDRKADRNVNHSNIMLN